ncbi:MAG: tRNA pseudouridine(13) synthase TruD [Pseudomonadota bacterium]
MTASVDETRAPAAVYPWVPPLVGTFKACPEDFRVEELPATLPEGKGEHVWLEIEKRELNSEDVAVWLGRMAGVGRARVSFAGRKDRQAMTRQWFSVQCPPDAGPDWSAGAAAWSAEREAAGKPGRVEVLRAERHARKLRTGHLRGNRFVLRLREVRGDFAMADEVLESVRLGGVPNYFGAQRFGRDNLRRARAWFVEGRKPHGRNQRSLWLSAARAAIFNAVLAERVTRSDWDRLLPGDVANLEGSGSVFAVPEVDAELEVRAARLDVHPTGPLWGAGESLAGGAVHDLETTVARRYPHLAAGLVENGLKAARRSLRMVPRALEWQRDADGLELRLELGAGEYATSVLDALLRAPGDDAPGQT